MRAELIAPDEMVCKKDLKRQRASAQNTGNCQQQGTFHFILRLQVSTPASKA